ncbi:hypothetical protein N657DRAFT_687355 [Parathielavia appendiculata]|uniref:Uncharacterized protein n=1 Tax=Parathielavia appendiculata TaxID=2587402 RepID=A0AAN6U6X0_9PEZI|nr:hypothetical protein N657DRAFT_687355 [Parathielavia appendiculata]
MPTATTDAPAVALSFANNFWGKDDAGVQPLLERMHNAKQTCDELKAFYSARASIEDEYARKLLSLSRKSLGSQEMGTLKTSLDTVRGEVESMAKQHQHVAAQMKSELEEPLAAFAGAMKERRKIVQNTVEKLLKTKVQQTQLVNKTRDRYEQECLKIKGYLAQGHMVMGQEERKNKAKLEKTQISLATSNAEYEAAVKALEETTARWNREWKAAADKFQDLEEERLDFTKSSLWTFANIASTVCVSDDSSCEKIRLSLEKMEVEKDITTFIKERGTGQEIPDPPKYINFCRGDVDSQSEVSEDENYSVAQFPRSINPAFRSSSPQPSTFESHHDPNSALARDLGHGDSATPQSREATVTPQKFPVIPHQENQNAKREPPRGYQHPRANNLEYDPSEFAPVPHDPYPMDGMTMLCRPTGSDLSTTPSTSSARPSSRDSHSETSFSSQEPPAPVSPVKQEQPTPATSPDKKVLKKKSGFFQNHSPFRRKSTKEVAPTSRNTWNPSTGTSRPQLAAAPRDNHQIIASERSVSPDPIAANASLALNVGQNVFPVETPDRQKQVAAPTTPDDDPIALALAELKGVTIGKNSAMRMSADHYHGIATPAPGASPSRSMPGSANNSVVAAAVRGTPPPSYDQQIQVQRLGVPPPAVTAKAMKESSQKFQQQTRSLFSSSTNRPGSGGGYGSSRPGTSRGSSSDIPRAVSPAPQRSVSPRPDSRANASPHPFSSSASSFSSNNNNTAHHQHRSVSPAPSGYAGSHRGSVSQLSMTPKQQRGSDSYYGRGGGTASPNDMARAASPAPYSPRASGASPAPYTPRESMQEQRPSSSMSNGRGMGMGIGGDNMAVQLAPVGQDGAGSMRGRHNRSNTATSMSMRGMSLYEGAGPVQPVTGGSRVRSKSVAADPGRYTRDGRPILHFARALYMYQAAIPEELGFAKGDVLAILRHQDDGWWEATVQGGNGQEPSLDEAKRNLDALFQETLDRRQRAARDNQAFAHGPISPAWVQKTVIGASLLAIAGILLYIPAALSYLHFYYKFLPDLETTVPVHLQYGVGPNPFGIASLQGLASRQPYDVTVSLTLPRSPINLERANFMIALHLLSPSITTTHQESHDTLPYLPPSLTPTDSDASSSPSWENSLDALLRPTRLNLPSYLASHTILHTSTRPALIPYVDPIASLAKQILFLPYHMLVTHSRGSTVHLTVPMAEDLSFRAAATAPRSSSRASSLLPQSLLLEVQAGQAIQVYEARVTLVARLKGLRGFMYRWRVTAFVLGSAGFWVGEMVVVGVAALVTGLMLGKGLRYLVGARGGGTEPELEAEAGEATDWRKWLNEEEDKERGGDSSASPIVSRRDGRGKGTIKKEKEGEEMPKVPAFGGGSSTEADDEGESARRKGKGNGKEKESESKDLGVETSFIGETSREGVRRRNVSGQESPM